VTAIKDGCKPPPGKPCPDLVSADYEADANRFEEAAAVTYYDVIQWVPGAGQPRHIGWMDLLKRIQKDGKGLEVHASIEEIKIMHKDLRPGMTIYCAGAESVKEAEDLIAWLKRNT